MAGPYGEAWPKLGHALEIDEPQQGLAQRRRRVEAGVIDPKRGPGAAECSQVRCEEARNAGADRCPKGELIGKPRPGGPASPGVAPLNARPELLEPLKPARPRVAGDNGRVDRTDGCADDPIGLDMRLVQRLIDPDLVGAEGATALQHQDNLAAPRAAERLNGRMRLCPRGHVVHAEPPVAHAALTPAPPTKDPYTNKVPSRTPFAPGRRPDRRCGRGSRPW